MSHGNVRASRDLYGTLDAVLVYPTPDEPLYATFSGATPGAIACLLLEEARDRGTVVHLAATFTDDLDSAGRPWPRRVWQGHAVGVTLGYLARTWLDVGLLAEVAVDDRAGTFSMWTRP